MDNKNKTYSSIFKIFGKNVRLCRTSLDWSQEDLANESGVSISVIGPMERGERSLSFISVYAVCQSIGVTIDKMIQETSVIDLINGNPTFSKKVNGKIKKKHRIRSGETTALKKGR